MKAIVMPGPGLADQLFYEDVPKPSIEDGQALVKIYAASVNHIDWKLASGQSSAIRTPEFPWIPGMDFAGQIERLGTDVEGFNVGDPVFGCTLGGAYAEYIAADPGQIVLKPLDLSYTDAAGAAYVSQTAWQAVAEHGKLMRGQRVLIHGAAGGVGAFAVQFAALIGADIYATGEGRDREFVTGLGANVFIDYLTEDFVKMAPDMDLVIDLVGGQAGKRSYEVVKPSGRLVSLTMPVDERLAEERKITAIRMVVKPEARDLRKIAALMEEHDIKVDIAAVFWLRDACKAWNYLLDPDPDRKVHGKVVLQVV